MPKTLDELAENAGRAHADKVFDLMAEFPPEAHQDVLALGARTVGIAAARYVAILRESDPPDEVVKVFCEIFVAAYNEELIMRKAGREN